MKRINKHLILLITPYILIIILMIVSIIHGNMISKQKRTINYLEDKIENLDSQVNDVQNDVSDLENTISNIENRQNIQELFP